MKKIETAWLFYRPDNTKAAASAQELHNFLKSAQIELEESDPELVIALGGDGTIIEAAHTFPGAAVLGLNMGTFGFLASARNAKDFRGVLERVLAGSCDISERNLLQAQVRRQGQIVEEQQAVNDLAITSPLSMVQLEVEIDGYSYQFIRGTGVLIATPTGSTAYNISAHGPIVEPTLGAIIINELLDHNVPTPPLVVKDTHQIKVTVNDFRRHGQITLTDSKKPADVVLSSDGGSAFPLEKGDEILVEKSDNKIKFVELDNHHFFASLRDKFAIE